MTGSDGTTPKISEILHLAADKYLDDGAPQQWLGIDFMKSDYSCDAIWQAVGEVGTSAHERDCLMKRISAGLQRLGLEPRSLTAFEDIKSYYERQQVRYAWLKFCALLAEEQGV